MKAIPLSILLVPLAVALPVSSCADPCAISARSEGYVVPAALLASGQSVTFVSADIGHLTADGTGVGGADGCFAVRSSPGVADTPVTLAIVGASLVATVNGVSTPCASATALPAGGFALPFFCKIHTNMRGALVIR